MAPDADSDGRADERRFLFAGNFGENSPMTAILYPVASNAEQALARPLGRAARESEARRMVGEAVVFATDPAGPAFATREAALEAYGARVEDAAAEDRYCTLVEQLAAP